MMPVTDGWEFIQPVSDEEEGVSEKHLLAAVTGRGEIYCLNSSSEGNFSICAQMIGFEKFSITLASKIGNNGLFLTSKEGAFFIFDMANMGKDHHQCLSMSHEGPCLVNLRGASSDNNWSTFASQEAL